MHAMEYFTMKHFFESMSKMYFDDVSNDDSKERRDYKCESEVSLFHSWYRRADSARPEDDHRRVERIYQEALPEKGNSMRIFAHMQCDLSCLFML